MGVSGDYHYGWLNHQHTHTTTDHQSITHYRNDFECFENLLLAPQLMQLFVLCGVEAIGITIAALHALPIQHFDGITKIDCAQNTPRQK